MADPMTAPASPPDLEASADGPRCLWVDDVGMGEWIPACNGGGFEFNDGGPGDNGFRFCPYCGKPLVEELYEN